MIECVRRIQFCAGHRVWKHESKCAHPHGHNYVLFIHANASQLDDVGRVIDFSVLKEKIGGWVDRFWDHGFIYNENDIEMCTIFRDSGYKSFEMSGNPTAENMAKFIALQVAPNQLHGSNVRVRKVVLWETENCFASYELADGVFQSYE